MNIREVLKDLGIPFKEYGESSLVTEGWLGVSCPYCGVGTGKMGMGIHTRTLAVNCWKCGKHRIGDVLSAITDKPIRDILRILSDLDVDITKQKEKPTGVYREPDGVGPLLSAHKKYLTDRRFDPEEMESRWGMKGIGADWPLRWRLFMPISRHGVNESWTTRAVGDQNPRYISAKPSEERRSIKSLLFGLDHVKHAVVVVEGIFDALRIGPGAVATFGLAVTHSQLSVIARIPIRVVCFDSEHEAQKRARALADMLTPYPGITHVATLSGPDPDTSPDNELDELRNRFLN